jgi:hypothetical protein
METQVKVLAVLYIVLSALGTLAAFVIATVFSVASMAVASDGDAAVALPIIGLTGTALVAFLLVVSLPGFVAGIGLLKFKPWARILTIVLSALNLINFPLGTIVGIYGLYVLLSEEGARLFAVAPKATT